MTRWIPCIAVSCLALACSDASVEPRIRLDEGTIVAEGIPSSITTDAIEVSVDGAARPMLGQTSRDGDTLRFEPRFALTPGLRYRAVVRMEPPLSLSFELPRAEPGPAPRIEHVYPSSEQVPENQLKLYVHFSAPMRQGEAYARVQLLDDTGKVVEIPFVELEPELWDPQSRRLTLLFDPGRIKRGLVPNQDIGPPLVAGRRYTLRIDGGWRDAAGTPLLATFERSIDVVTADREPVDPRTWKLEAPHIGTREPLRATFPESLDHALLERLLAVRDASDALVPGVATITRDETEWSFTPTVAWQPGAHRLVFDASLEDLAGNRIGRAFDVDRFDPITRSVGDEPLGLAFEPR